MLPFKILIITEDGGTKRRKTKILVFDIEFIEKYEIYTFYINKIFKLSFSLICYFSVFPAGQVLYNKNISLNVCLLRQTNNSAL